MYEAIWLTACDDSQRYTVRNLCSKTGDRSLLFLILSSTTVVYFSYMQLPIGNSVGLAFLTSLTTL